MKKITLLSFILLLISGLSGVYSQTSQGDFNIGAGFGYGFDIEEPSLGLNTNYAVADNFRIAGDFIYYFVSDMRFSEGTIETTAFELNLNLQYLFLNRENFNIYALTGLNYVRISASSSTSQNSVSATEAGINLGSGIELNISPTTRLFSEGKYAFGDASQFILNGGLRFRINR